MWCEWINKVTWFISYPFFNGFCISWVLPSLLAVLFALVLGLGPFAPGRVIVSQAKPVATRFPPGVYFWVCFEKVGEKSVAWW